MKELYVGRKDIFYNSDCLFIEYEDIIKSPQFFILTSILDNKELNTFFELDKFHSYTDIKGNIDLNALYEWYVNRKYKNFLYDLIRGKDAIEKRREAADIILTQLKREVPDIYKGPELNFSKVVKTIISLPTNPLVHDVIVWSETEITGERKDIMNLYGDKVRYVNGPLSEVISQVPANSTFVFSDMNHVLLLKENNHLELSSIILPANYGYNMANNELIFDISKLQTEISFKYQFFDNIHEN